MRVRVGDPDSLVQPGDVSAEGRVYTRGMFSPDMNDLSVDSLQSADSLGLLSKELPIYGDDGEVDETLLENWEPESVIPISRDMPKYSSAVIVSAMNRIRGIAKAVGVKSFVFEKDSGGIVTARTDVSGREFASQIVISHEFHKYVDKPVVPHVPGRVQGISVAEYSIYHTLGHILFAKLSFDGKIGLVGNFIENSGWSKFATGNAVYGSFLHERNSSVWRRDSEARFPTEAAKYSPMDDFAEAFTLYYVNRPYLEKFPEKYDAVVAGMRVLGY